MRIQGLTALIALGILDNLEEQGKVKSLLEMEHNSAEYLHTLVETLRYVICVRISMFILTMIVADLPSRV